MQVMKQVQQGVQERREVVLAVSDSGQYQNDDWIIASGSGIHLVNDK